MSRPKINKVSEHGEVK